MGDTPQDKEQKVETGLARTELTLAALRAEPLQALLKEGVESAYTSAAQKTEKGLKIDTTNDKTHAQSTMLVDKNKVDASRGLLSTELNADFTITHGTGKTARVEKDEFHLKGSNWDEVMGRPDKFNVAMTRKDASGNAIQVYEPAHSTAKIENGHYVLDPNGQPLREAKPAGSDINAEMSYATKKQETEYIIHDAKLGDLSYNQTREKTASGFYYRSVVRDLKGSVLGIVDQSVSVDENNEVTSVHTSARKPRKVNQR